MPQEPKRRHSRQRKGKRRASISLTISQSMLCTNCGATKLSHAVCIACGYYSGKQVLPVKFAQKQEEKK